MKVTDLQEIKDYWNKKYPHVEISIYKTYEGDRYFGRMMKATASVFLNASSIGDLINQGENFLRKANK
jgi:hypothetical protein